MEILENILSFLFGVVIFVFFKFLGSCVIMFVVNWVCSLFAVDFSITLLQAFGIDVLLTLVGGFFKSARR